jgi:hypothetical protein
VPWFFAGVGMVVGLGGCGLGRMMPGGPVSIGPTPSVSPPMSSTPDEGGAAQVSFPVVPLQVFGAFYDLDLVIMSKHPDWDMHEYARIRTPSGDLWMAKDSRLDGVQTITANRWDIHEALAEVAVPRVFGPVKVEDRSTEAWVDVDLAYTNPDGDAVVVQFSGALPDEPPSRRNGSTMGHSRQAVQAVLDLQRFGLDNQATIQIAGEKQRLKRILGVQPGAFLLQQAQGGISVASYLQGPAEGGFTVDRPGGRAETDPATGKPGWPTQRSETWKVESESGEVQTASWSDGVTSLRYTFVAGGLKEARVEQFGRTEPVFVLQVEPPLPDLSRTFVGMVESRVRYSVNGQADHGVGVARAQWRGADCLEVDLLPEDPWWLADRPMRSVIRYEPEGRVHVETGRLGTGQDPSCVVATP